VHVFGFTVHLRHLSFTRRLAGIFGTSCGIKALCSDRFSKCGFWELAREKPRAVIHPP